MVGRPRLLFALLLSLLFASLSAFAAAPLAQGANRLLFHFAWRYGLLFLLYLVALRFWQHSRLPDRLGSAIIWGTGLLVRLSFAALTPLHLSGDLYRYLWDGRLLLAGQNPYGIAPADPALAAFTDWLHFSAMFHQDIPTIYPPGAQAFFFLLYAIGHDSLSLARLLLIGIEMTGALVLWRQFRLSNAALALWLWHPLSLFEVAYSGHLDALVMLLAVLALLAAEKGREALAGAIVGILGLVKIYPLLLGPVLWRSRRFALPIAAATVVSLGLLPLFLGRGGIGATLRWFGETGWFNAPIAGSLRAVLMQLLPASLAQPITLAILASVILTVVFSVLLRPRQATPDLPGRALIIGGVAIIFSPAIHPWYLLWLIPFLCLRPYLPLLLLTGSVGLSHAYYLPGSQPLHLAIMLLQFTPPALALVLYLGRR